MTAYGLALAVFHRHAVSIVPQDEAMARPVGSATFQLPAHVMGFEEYKTENVNSLPSSPLRKREPLFSTKYKNQYEQARIALHDVTRNWILSKANNQEHRPVRKSHQLDIVLNSPIAPVLLPLHTPCAAISSPSTTLRKDMLKQGMKWKHHECGCLPRRADPFYSRRQKKQICGTKLLALGILGTMGKSHFLGA